MSALAEKKYFTFSEYLAKEIADGVKYEYFDGEIFAMVGTTKRHNAIVQTLSRLLYPFSKKSGCQVFTESIKQQLERDKKYVYPDVIYTCDKDDLANDEERIVNSPSLLIEVVSSSSEETDRVHKRGEYFNLPTLQCYLIVHQSKYLVECYERGDVFWKYRRLENLHEPFLIEVLDISLSLSDIYEGVSIEV